MGFLNRFMRSLKEFNDRTGDELREIGYDPDPDVTGDDCYQRGITFRDSGKLHEALMSLRQAAALYEKNGDETGYRNTMKVINSLGS